MSSQSQTFKTKNMNRKQIAPEKLAIIMEAIGDYKDSIDDNWNYLLPNRLEFELEHGKDYFLLDTREPEKFHEGHIAGAHNIFWIDLLEMLRSGNFEALPEDKEIILACYVGHTASQAMVALQMCGYECRVMKFGMGKSPVAGVDVKGWETLGLPVV